MSPRLFPLLAIVALSLGLSSCTEEDVCASISTCAGCAGEYVSNACKWCPSDNSCSAYGEASSCSYSELADDADECGPPSGGACSGAYSGPTADPQSAPFCQAAWNYGCQGRTQERNDNCRVYAQLRADNPGLPACPYCP